MKAYWPMAKYIYTTFSGKENIEKLFTTDPALTMQKALEQFSLWEGNFSIIEAWIDVTEDGEKVDRLEVVRTWQVKGKSEK